MKSSSGMIDRSCVAVIRIVIRQTLCAATAVCPPCTLSNTVRKRRLFTAVYKRALRVKARHPDIWVRCAAGGYTENALVTYICPLGFWRRFFTVEVLTSVHRFFLL